MAQQLYVPGIYYRVSLDKLFTTQEIEEFIALYQDEDVTEVGIHKFFSANPKFLYLLGAYNNIISEISFASARNSSQQKLRLDFLLQHYDKVWDVVELKKPRLRDGNLVVGPSTRPRFASELQDAIAQVRVYLDELGQAEIQRDLQRRGILVCQPKAWIIAGRNDKFPLKEKRFLEETLPHSIQLVTYDDLAELSKQRALIVTKSILLPFAAEPDISGKLSELLAQCKLGSNAAWLEFTRRYNSVITTAVLKTLRERMQPYPSLVEDLVMNTYLKLIENNYSVLANITFYDPDQVHSYIHLIARNVAVDFFRKGKASARHAEIQLEGALSEASDGEIKNADYQLILGRLDAIVKQLPDIEKDKQRTIFRLYYQYGFTVREISQLPTLKLGVKQIENILMRLRMQIIKKLEGTNGKDIYQLEKSLG